MFHAHHSRRDPRLSVAIGLAVLSGGLMAALMLARNGLQHTAEDAPQRALRRQGWTGPRVVGRSVTIARPRDEVYEAWREFRRFPEFMENVISVEPLDRRRSKWMVEGPGDGPIEFVSVITQDEPGRTIAWTSEEGAAVSNSGRVTFRDATGGRGTEVDLELSYDPPGGAIGAAVARMFQREPKIQSRRDLRRFKQFMETGEIASAAPRRMTNRQG